MMMMTMRGRALGPMYTAHVNFQVVEQFITSMASVVAELLMKEGLFDPAMCKSWKSFFFMIMTFLCEGIRAYDDNPQAKKTMTSYEMTAQQTEIVVNDFSHLINSLGPLETGIAILQKWCVLTY